MSNRKEYLKKYRLEHKEKYKEYQRKYRKTHLSTYELLKKENQELKKQLKATEEVVEEHMKKWVTMETQQKEFIKYLEDMIKLEKTNLEDLCEKYNIPKENNGAYKFAYSYINKVEEILSKYKEIIGSDKE